MTERPMTMFYGCLAPQGFEAPASMLFPLPKQEELLRLLSVGTAVLLVLASFLLSSAVWGSDRQAIEQAAKGSSLTARMSKEIRERDERLKAG